MITYVCAAILALTCQAAPQTQPPAAPQQQPPAAPPKPSKGAPTANIFPKLDLQHAATYTFRLLETSRDVSTGGSGDWKEDVTWQVCVTPVAFDAGKQETEVEVEFLSLQAAWTSFRFTERYDSNVPYKPKPRPKSLKPGMEQDGLTFSDVPFDRVIHDYFSPLAGAKVRFRVNTHGRILKFDNEPTLGQIKAMSFTSPCELLAHVFGAAAGNDEQGFEGAVRTGEKWSSERPPGKPAAGGAQNTTLTQYVVRSVAKDRVEIESTETRRNSDGTLVPKSNYEKRAGIIWNSSLGQLDSAKFVTDEKSKHVAKDGKGKEVHGSFERHRELQIERVKSPAPTKPSPPKKPGDSSPATPR